MADLDASVDSGSNYFAIPEFAINRMISPTMSVGLTLYGNGGMNTDYEGGQLPSPGACGHALGIAPLFAYQRFEAVGIQAFAGFSTSPGDVSNRGYDNSTGYGVRVGYYGQVAPGFAIGAGYASRMKMSEFDKYKGLFAERGGFDIPSHWSVGATFRASPTAAGELRAAFPGWTVLVDEPSTFGAPGGSVKRFETVIARRPD